MKKLYKSDEERSIHDNHTEGASYKTTKNFRKGEYTDIDLEFNEK